LDAAVRQIDESTPDDVIEELVAEITAAIIEFGEREQERAGDPASAGATEGRAAAGMDAGAPITDVALAWAESTLNPRAREAFQRVVAAVMEHFGPDSPEP
jgi:hypothetical protein